MSLPWPPTLGDEVLIDGANPATVHGYHAVLRGTGELRTVDVLYSRSGGLGLVEWSRATAPAGRRVKGEW